MASVPGPTSALRTDTLPRINLLFYELGLFLWSVLVLRTLRDTLA
ncbi:hypothetical protein [Halogeometricum luteum]|nr:hypothetical protein [Halogeometricum sp. S3BR5-2]